MAETQAEIHAREIDRLREQCSTCRRWKPNTPTKDCDIRKKLVTDDNQVAWKHKHLFFHQPGMHCKMYQPKEAKLHGVR